MKIRAVRDFRQGFTEKSYAAAFFLLSHEHVKETTLRIMNICIAIFFNKTPGYSCAFFSTQAACSPGFFNPCSYYII